MSEPRPQHQQNDRSPAGPLSLESWRCWWWLWRFGSPGAFMLLGGWLDNSVTFRKKNPNKPIMSNKLKYTSFMVRSVCSKITLKSFFLGTNMTQNRLSQGWLTILAAGRSGCVRLCGGRQSLRPSASVAQPQGGDQLYNLAHKRANPIPTNMTFYPCGPQKWTYPMLQ